VLLAIVAGACGGSMTKEQRQEMLEAREQQSIRKISEAELLEKALEEGRRLANVLEKIKPGAMDSLAQVEGVTIRFVEAGSDQALEVERQLIEAYVVSAMTGDTPDNIQKVEENSLLYSKPEIEMLADSTIRVKGMYSIVFPVKKIVF